MKKTTQLEAQGKQKSVWVIVTIGIFLLSLSLISAQTWTSNLDNSLKVYYNFDEGGVSNATDNSGNNNTGINNGDVTRLTGKIGKAINISLSTRWINFSNALSLNAGSNYTVSYWTYFDNITATQVIHRLGTGANGEQAMVLSNQYRWNRNGIGGVQTGTTANLTTWDFHTIVVNTTGIKWYVNTNNIYECSSSCRQLATDVGALIGSDSTNYMIGKIDEFALWNKTLNTTEISQLYNSGNGLTYGFGRNKNITVNLLSPEENYTASPSTSQITINFYSQQGYSNILAGNSTIHVWNATGSLVKSNTTTTNSTNGSSFSLTNIGYGTHYWNVLANDSTNTQKEYAFSNNTINIKRGSNLTTYDYNTTSYLTQAESYSINVSVGEGLTITRANLWYEGTNYTTTISNHTSGNYKLVTTRYINNTIGTKNFFFSVTYSDGVQENLSTTTQTIDPVSFGLCNSTLTVKYLNVSFKNETVSSESIKSAISAGSFVYYLSDISNNLTFTYSNTTEANSFVICGIPASKSFYLKYDINYYNSESQQRSYSQNTQLLTNSTTNTVLYLLPTSQGQYVTFAIINIAEQAVTGARVTITRSGYGTVSSAISDSAGSVTFFLNPNFAYTISITHDDHNDYSTTITPAETSYTISLSGGVTINNPDYNKGITYSIRPTNRVISNATQQQFNFTITSSYWSLESFGFTLRNRSGYNLGSATSTSGSGGTISQTITTSANKSQIIMYYYWIINGTENNGTISWDVYNITGSSWSINNFFIRIKNYSDDGILGMNNFSLSIITFLAIFLITGFVSYKFGLNDPRIIVGIIFLLTAFFNYQLGFIDSPINSVPYLPTVIMGLIALTIILKEYY